MFGSNRDNLASAFRLAIYVVTAFGALIVLWQISGLYAERRQNAGHRANSYAESADRRISDVCGRAIGSALINCVTKEVKASREDQRIEYDLLAQQDSADAAFWMAVVSFLSLSATIVALWFVKGTLDATREAVRGTTDATKEMRAANEIAQETATRQLRAYVIIRETTIDGLVPDQNPAISYKLVNVGQTPAYETRHRARIFFGKSVEEISEQKVTLGDRLFVSRSTLGSNLPSGGGFGLFANAVLTKADYDRIMAGTLVIGFLAVVSYRDIYKRRRLTTVKSFLQPQRIVGESGRFISCDKGSAAN